MVSDGIKSDLILAVAQRVLFGFDFRYFNNYQLLLQAK